MTSEGSDFSGRGRGGRLRALAKEGAVPRTLPLVPLLVAASVAAASAQSLNVDFGAGDAPAPSYAAVGAAGVWNAVGVLASGVRAPLVDLAGNASPARLTMIGGAALLASDDPLTSGDDDALLDDMLLGFNNPVDVCVWVENLANGEYGVILYAMTPNDPERSCRTRVDYAAEDPVDVGGAWSGAHQEKVTYSSFTVTVTDGTIGLHSGLWAGNFQSGLNGIQVLDLSTTDAPLLAGDAAPRLRAYPNPARGTQVLETAAARTGNVTVEILDVAGRVVWRDALVARAPGLLRAQWDGRDLAGRPVAGAVYFARVTGAAMPPATVKLVRQE